MAEHYSEDDKWRRFINQANEGLGGSLNLASGGSRRFDGFDAKVTLEELV